MSKTRQNTKRKGTTFHICHWCKDVKGFYGNKHARFCSGSCRGASWKCLTRTLVQLVKDFFHKIGFSFDELLDFVDTFRDGVIQVAHLIGFEYNEIGRQWERY